MQANPIRDLPRGLQSRATLLPSEAPGIRGAGRRLFLFTLVVSACLFNRQARSAEAGDLEVSGGVIEIRIASRPGGVSIEHLRGWVSTAARAVSDYYGRFPVRRATLSIGGRADGHAIHGRTFSGRRIRMELGAALTEADLADDWVLTHEMFHLAFPDLDEAHLWMNEGLSTYLEPVARVRIGTLSADRVWGDMMRMIPRGLPRRGDKGLDRTHTWGRTYWGGCLFWLLVDVRIRERTHHQRSLEDALRAILHAGGDGSETWSVGRVIEVGDHATGTRVLRELYDQMALTPETTDLHELWKQLGVRDERGRVSFDDDAPLSDVRRAITAAHANK